MKKFIPSIGLAIAILFMGGCVGNEKRFTTFVDGLNERQWKGCYANNVNFAGGFGATASITASGYVLTGGMTVEDCVMLRTNRLMGE